MRGTLCVLAGFGKRKTTLCIFYVNPRMASFGWRVSAIHNPQGALSLAPRSLSLCAFCLLFWRPCRRCLCLHITEGAMPRLLYALHAWLRTFFSFFYCCCPEFSCPPTPQPPLTPSSPDRQPSHSRHIHTHTYTNTERQQTRMSTGGLTAKQTPRTTCVRSLLLFVQFSCLFLFFLARLAACSSVCVCVCVTIIIQ